MLRDTRAFLYDIVAAAGAIAQFLKGLDFDDYLESDMVRSVVERKLEIIGEALNQLTRLQGGPTDRISQWRDIIAFRNIIVHGYSSLDDHIVWRAQQESLPALRAEVLTWLAELGAMPPGAATSPPE